jgi:uroporphyrin-III C-methyltransferase/precorrin-2 dehydrogenase/sirohydrochlorin ferrochelatase/uroporphyrin-III C-methyltransferase
VIDENYWKELAATDDTLVFYMSSETLDGVVSNLVKNGISADKLLAVVEQATTPLQNVQVTNLYDYAQNWKDKTFVSPALVIIGRVVGLHEQFAWIANSNSSESYFKPVAKLFTASTVVATENANQHVSRA